MIDLYVLAQLIKAHPLYRTHRDEIHFVFYYLGLEKRLNPSMVIEALSKKMPELAKALLSTRDSSELALQKALRLQSEGVCFVCAGEEDYPRAFYKMEDPPLSFTFCGRPVWNQKTGLTVVGSREPSFESLQWMERELGSFCQSVEVAIISGGARGVDQKAHALALRFLRPTVVVLPSGLGCVYPSSLGHWKASILESGGCLLSEYGYEMPMQKYLFHHRNRLIAALGKATLIVEARQRSGTLITAELSCQMGRPVWVLPGHPQDPNFAGSLRLLAEGATLIRHAADLLDMFTLEADIFLDSPKI